jgi:acetyl esterase
MTERAYDPELIDLVPLLPAGGGPIEPADVSAYRDGMGEFIPATDPREDVTREDRTISGRDGDPEVAIRIYRPATLPDTQTPDTQLPDTQMPGFLEIHGGGFFVGNIDMMDGFCDGVAAEFPAVVVSVGYRLAPEDPFPAGVEDCYAALVWFADNAAKLGVDIDRIAVGGQSAGGGLAAATALLARDRGGPSLCFQLLEIPELDDRLETPSMIQFTDTPLWNRPNAQSSWEMYLGEDNPARGSDGVSPYAAPARAEDLSGLPPAYVSVMEFDPLRDEGIRYASRLLECGVSTELHAFPGTFHGSAFVQNAGVSKRSGAEMFEALRRALS